MMTKEQQIEQVVNFMIYELEQHDKYRGECDCPQCQENHRLLSRILLSPVR